MPGKQSLRYSGEYFRVRACCRRIEEIAQGFDEIAEECASDLQRSIFRIASSSANQFAEILGRLRFTCESGSKRGASKLSERLVRNRCHRAKTNLQIFPDQQFQAIFGCLRNSIFVGQNRMF